MRAENENGTDVLFEFLRTRAIPAGIDTARLMHLARSQKIIPQVYSALQAEKRTAQFTREYLKSTGHNLLVFAEAKSLVRELRKQKIYFIFTKGVPVAQKFGADTEKYVGDIDLLIKKEQLPEIESVLYAQGWGAHFDYPLLRAARLRTDCQLPAFGKNGILLDLHWGLSNYVEVEPAELWTGAQEFTFEGTKALELSSEEQALYLCLHSAFSHGFEFIVKDALELSALVSFHPHDFNWSEFTAKARLRGLSASAYLCLLQAKEKLGAEIPEGTLAELRKGSGRAQLLAMHAFRPGKFMRFSMQITHLKGARRKAGFLFYLLFPPAEHLINFSEVRADKPLQLLMHRAFNPARLALKVFRN